MCLLQTEQQFETVIGIGIGIGIGIAICIGIDIGIGIGICIGIGIGIYIGIFFCDLSCETCFDFPLCFESFFVFFVFVVHHFVEMK